MKKFEFMKTMYTERYSTETDEDIKNLLALWEKAENLSYTAKKEFVKMFSFKHALDGKIYVGSERRALAMCPNLYTEAPALGINLTMR